jgi:hypothetical protein
LKPTDPSAVDETPSGASRHLPLWGRICAQPYASPMWWMIRETMP